MPIVLAGHTYAFRELALEPALDRLAALGFEHVELWAGHAPGDVEAVRAAIDDRALELVAVGGGGFYSPADDPSRLVELARRLDAPVMVACVAPTELGRVAAAVDAPPLLCIENHWDQQLATAAAVRAALASTPSATACLDTGHALLAGVRPAAFVRLLGPLLRHVHLKEGRLPTLRERILGRRIRRRLLDRPEPVFPGEGALSVAALRRELERSGYTGAITLEHEGGDASEALVELRRRWLEAG